MNAHLASLAIAFLLAGSAAQATNSGCTILLDSEVARQFDRPDRGAGNTAGSCAWSINNDLLTAQVFRHPSAAAAREIFDGLEQQMLAPSKRTAVRPPIGQKAVAGISAPDRGNRHASAIVLDQEWVTVISYLTKAESRLVPALIDKLVSLARQANARAAEADQSLGACEWFSREEAAALVGAAGLVIHRHGPIMCIASSTRPSAVLMVTVPEHLSAESSVNRRRNDDKLCIVTPVPELGPEAYAAHTCTVPGKPPLPGVHGHVQKNGRYAEAVYTLGDRPAVADDLTLLKAAMRRTLGSL